MRWGVALFSQRSKLEYYPPMHSTLDYQPWLGLIGRKPQMFLHLIAIASTSSIRSAKANAAVSNLAASEWTSQICDPGHDSRVDARTFLWRQKRLGWHSL